MTRPSVLYLPHELIFRTQYAEVKERARGAGSLLPGTPGRLVMRSGTGHDYWYRTYYSVPGQEVETFICKDGESEETQALLQTTRDRIAFSDWTARQVRDLRKLEFQVADKAVSRVLVELHNAGLFAGGLVLVGTLGYVAWLNELGAKAVSARTQNIDLARRHALKVAASLSFLRTIQATELKFFPVPVLGNKASSTSAKRPGAEALRVEGLRAEGLRVDLLTDGPEVGASIAIPELQWHAQTIPHYDYLLRDPHPAAILAGGHCIPLQIPSAQRFFWHKVFSSATRTGEPEKAAKDLLQAATLAAILIESNDADVQELQEALDEAPVDIKLTAVRQLPALGRLMAAHRAAFSGVETAVRDTAVPASTGSSEEEDLVRDRLRGQSP